MRLVNIKPRRGARILIGAIPIILILIVYALVATARAELNPNEKVLPTFAAMGQAMVQLTQVDPRTGEITAWSDTIASLWRLDLDEKTLREIAAGLGSDVPVCVGSLSSFMEGRGEILTPVPVLPRLPLLLVNPGVAVPTKDVFARLERRRGADTALPRGRFSDLADLLRFLETTGNDLESPAIMLQPVIGAVLKALKGHLAALKAMMAGVPEV